MTPAFLTLRCGDLQAEIAPAAGGSLASFTAGGRDLMRRFDRDGAASLDDPLAMACFPLVPFSNRIAQGTFRFMGRTVVLPPDPIAPSHAIHGLGWRQPWEIVDADEREAVLRFRHEGGDWPWPFEATETFMLDGDALVIALTLANKGATAMPAGLGLHPFFPGRMRARLEADFPFVWESGEDRIPLRRIPTPREWSFDPPRAVAPLALDHCFSGAESPLVIRWDDRSLSIEREGAPHAMIYTPRHEEFFCVEPVSHVPDAFNRPEGGDVTGMRSVMPGETIRLSCRFAVGTL